MHKTVADGSTSIRLAHKVVDITERLLSAENRLAVLMAFADPGKIFYRLQSW